MSMLQTLRAFFGNIARAVQMLAEIRDGIANLTDVTDRRLKAVESAVAQTRRLSADTESSARPPQSTGPIATKGWPGASRPLQR